MIVDSAKTRTRRLPVSYVIHRFPGGRNWILGLLLGLVLLAGALPAITPGELARAEDDWLRAARSIREMRFGREAPDSTKDPSGSGLIGSEDGPWTTTLGSLSSKQSTCQSGWCRVIAALLDSARVARGDTVAVTMTGSFPALDLAVLMVLQAGGIEWKAVSSYGSSSWGATEAGASWPEMERHLHQEGLLSRRSLWFTPGGSNDRFSGLPFEKVYALERLMKGEPRAVHPGTLSQAVDLRRQAFGRWRNLAAYINVGGGHAAIGSNHFGRLADPGLMGENERLLAEGLEDSDGVTGLLQYYLMKGLPVIQFQAVHDLTEDWGLPHPPRELRSPAFLEDRP